MARSVAVQQRKNAVVLRQRPKGLLSRLLQRKIRQPVHVPDGNRGIVVSRGGRAARRNGRPPTSQADQGSRAAGGEAQVAARSSRSGGKILRGAVCRPERRAGKGLREEAGLEPGNDPRIPHRLRSRESIRIEGASGKARDRGRGHGRGGTAGRRRRYSG